MPVIRVATRNRLSWAQVRVLDMAKLTPQVGWVESAQVTLLPPDRFPADGDLLRQLGGEYLDDFTAAHKEIVRFLVHQKHLDPALVCLISSPNLPFSRLVAFLPAQGRFVPGPSLEFPASEMEPGIIAAQVRDLLGDGNECLVSREPFRQGPETRGINLVIRRIEGGAFKTLWTAPLEFRNLGLYPPRPEILQPSEKNIGLPGTLAKGDVSFHQMGSAFEPVWKGKVEFYVVGRDQPVNSVTVEKACKWDGEKFKPLR